MLVLLTKPDSFPEPSSPVPVGGIQGQGYRRQPAHHSVFVGMFATVAGISQRAPVHWSESVIGAALCFPYVLALDDQFITVHSMLDQQQKQTLPFKEGHSLQDFEGTDLCTRCNQV